MNEKNKGELIALTTNPPTVFNPAGPKPNKIVTTNEGIINKALGTTFNYILSDQWGDHEPTI
jgi:hypothetical protein